MPELSKTPSGRIWALDVNQTGRFLGGNTMKYMIEYSIRSAGLTHEQNLANADALLTAFSKWKPEDGLVIHAFVSNVAANGGYVLAETSDPKVIASFISKYNFWNDVSVTPVIDIGEVVPISKASLDWARSASKG
jgi:uncharacterized protein DUF3303